MSRSELYTERALSETSASALQCFIEGWRHATFGTPSVNQLELQLAQLKRVQEEITELVATIEEFKEVQEPRLVIKEMADVLITMFNASGVLGFDLLSAVRMKMKINLTREWESRGDGTGHHVKKSPYETSTEEKKESFDPFTEIRPGQ